MEYLLRFHILHETTRSSNPDIRDIFEMIEYLFDEIEKLKENISEPPKE